MTDEPKKEGIWLQRMSALFRKFRTPNSLTLFATLLTCIATIIAALIQSSDKPDSNNQQEIQYAGQVKNAEGHMISGAIVIIRDEQGTIKTSTTDSVGRYTYYMKPSSRSLHFTVIADKYVTYERDLPPTQTGSEPFILKHVPAPTPLPTPQPSPTTHPSPETKESPKITPPKKKKSQLIPTPTPCTAKDMLFGKCQREVTSHH